MIILPMDIERRTLLQNSTGNIRMRESHSYPGIQLQRIAPLGTG